MNYKKTEYSEIFSDEHWDYRLVTLDKRFKELILKLMSDNNFSHQNGILTEKAWR